MGKQKFVLMKPLPLNKDLEEGKKQYYVIKSAVGVVFEFRVKK